MNYIKAAESQTHTYYGNTVKVIEHNFPESNAANDAEIIILGRYPDAGFAVNNISTVLISVDSGSGEITKKESETQTLETGDRLIIAPGEPYFFRSLGKLAIRYIAMPAWTPEQAEIISD